MKVLWFTNILLPDARRHLGYPARLGSGAWMSTLLERLKKRSDIELAVVTKDGCRDYHFKADGVEYFVVKDYSFELVHRYIGSRAVPPSEAKLKRYASIVNDWNPDIVHIHGTEFGYGLIRARGLIDKPIAVSLQGLMSPYATKVYGDLLPTEIHGALRSVFGFKPQSLRTWKSFVDRIPAEEETLRSADMVLGRTQWDHAWAWASNPDVRYRHVDEIMRDEFYEADPWRIEDCRRYHIFCTSQDYPLKGVHLLLQAVHILRPMFSEIKLNVACHGFVPPFKNDYARYVWRLIRKWKLEDAVTFLGFQDARGIVEQLKQAHCYVTPSYIENGCNALIEAMLLGVPCVATSVGGMLTTVVPEQSGLNFPVGDAALLAWQVARIFRDERLATDLGEKARTVAKQRNDPALIEAQLLSSYTELASLGQLRNR